MRCLGLSSYACAWQVSAGGLDAVGVIQRARELGVRVVQLADNIPLDSEDEWQLAAIRNAARDAAIELELGARGLIPAVVHDYLRLCDALSVRLLRIVIDRPPYEPTPDEIVCELRKLLGPLRDAGVTLAIENHDRLSARVLSTIVSKLGEESIGICLDTANSFGALEGPEQVVEILGAQTVNLHLKDFVIAREAHNMGFRISGVPAGQGMLDVPSVLARLEALGARGNVILELWPPPERTAEESAAKEKRWCEESVAYLRTLIPD